MKTIRIHRPDSWFLRFSTFRIFVNDEFAGKLDNNSSLIVHVDREAEYVSVRAELAGGAHQELNVEMSRDSVVVEVNADGYVQRLIPVFVCLLPIIFAILLSTVSSAKILATVLVVGSTIASIYLMHRLKDRWISLRLTDS